MGESSPYLNKLQQKIDEAEKDAEYYYMQTLRQNQLIRGLKARVQKIQDEQLDGIRSNELALKIIERAVQSIKDKIQ